MFCLTLLVAMHPDAPYFSILLCLMPDDFTHQVESAATQWAKQHLMFCLLRSVFISNANFVLYTNQRPYVFSKQQQRKWQEIFELRM